MKNLERSLKIVYVFRIFRVPIEKKSFFLKKLIVFVSVLSIFFFFRPKSLEKEDMNTV